MLPSRCPSHWPGHAYWPGRDGAAAAAGFLGLLLGRVPGQGQEHVIEGRPPQREAAYLDARAVQAAHHLDQGLRAAAADPDADDARLRVDVRLALTDLGDRRHGVSDTAAVGHRELDHVPADPALQFLRGPGGDDQAAVENHDLVRQLVRLVEVLGSEQQRRPAGGQRPDDVPHAQPRPRVQARSRLVEEQHLGMPDETRGQVQAALHPAGEVLGGPVGRIEQVELLQQLVGPAAGTRPAQVIQPPDDLKVLPAGQLLLDGRRLPGQADRPADGGGLPHHVVAFHHCPAAVREQQRRQDAHRGRLAGTVRAEHAEHGPAGHRQVDAPQRVHFLE